MEIAQRVVKTIASIKLVSRSNKVERGVRVIKWEEEVASGIKVSKTVLDRSKE